MMGGTASAWRSARRDYRALAAALLGTRELGSAKVIVIGGTANQAAGQQTQEAEANNHQEVDLGFFLLDAVHVLECDSKTTCIHPLFKIPAIVVETDETVGHNLGFGYVETAAVVYRNSNLARVFLCDRPVERWT